MTSVASPFMAYLTSTIRRWLTAKGFTIVLIAALFPALFVGAWAATHRADIDVSALDIPGESLTEGDVLNITATFTNSGSTRVDAFNATVAIFQDPQFPRNRNTTNVEGLAPGESRQVTLTWTAEPGAFIIAGLADVGAGSGSGDIGERDENNNVRARVITVAYKAPITRPNAPAGLNGTENATATTDLVVESLTWSPKAPSATQTQINFTATVRNAGTEPVTDASAAIRISRMTGGRAITDAETPSSDQPISLAAGESKQIRFTWNWAPGARWAEAYVLPPADTSETDASNNDVLEPLILNQLVDPATKDQIEKPEEASFKQYYQGVIIGFYLSLVVPLIALFYAAGVISDEREAGTLPYLLTRPIPRWLIPISKWIAGFVVIAIATIIGLVISYAIMFGSAAGATGASGSYLAAPLLLTLLALAAYLGIFVALGVWSERPYIVGMLFVLVWETFTARLLIQTSSGSQPLLPWVGNLTVLQHVNNALAGWDFDVAIRWLPDGSQPMRAILALLGIAVVGLIAASAWMRKRDFQVG